MALPELSVLQEQQTLTVTHQNEILRRLPLLQSGSIVKAADLPHPELLSQTELQNLHRLGHRLAVNQPELLAVAYTQFEDQAYNLFKLPQTLRRIIYFSFRTTTTPNLPTENHLDTPFGQLALPDCLLINPEITLLPQTHTWIVHTECCGSIAKGQLVMFVKRPTCLEMSAFVYHPKHARGQLVKITQVSLLANLYAACFHHEMAHLDGLDATHFTETLVDPFTTLQLAPDPGATAAAQRQLGTLPQHKHLEFLVYRDNCLSIVNRRGEFLRPFIRQT